MDFYHLESGDRDSDDEWTGEESIVQRMDRSDQPALHLDIPDNGRSWDESDSETAEVSAPPAFPPEMYRLMLKAWPMENRVRINVLPPELWLEIFRCYLDSRASCFRDYNEARDDLCRDGPYLWGLFLKKNSAFWRYLDIDCVTEVGDVARHLRFCRTDWFDLDVSFDHDISFSSSRGNPIPSHRRAYRIGVARSCLSLAAGSVSQWRRVSLWSSTDFFMRPILDVIRALRAARMETLNLSGLSFALDSTVDRLFETPPPTFAGGVPCLRDLTVLQAAVSWTNHRYFSGLRNLTLSSIPFGAAPTPRQLVDILLSCPLLESLVTRSNVVGPSTDNARVPPYVLPCLRNLDVSGNSHSHSTLDFLSFGEFPRLDDLILTSFDAHGWLALRRTTFHSTVRSLMINGGSCPADIGDILDTFSQLSTLDLRVAQSVVPRSLFASPVGTCPSLRRLIVRDVPLRRLHDFLTCHPDGCKLDSVIYLQDYDGILLLFDLPYGRDMTDIMRDITSSVNTFSVGKAGDDFE